MGCKYDQISYPKFFEKLIIKVSVELVIESLKNLLLKKLDKKYKYKVFANAKEIKLNKSTFKDFAVLYRTNAQSRSIEQAMVKEGIPYNIVGGTKFYDRKEIKDVLAYLTLVANSNDDVALRRIINFPVRGIGEKSIKMFVELASRKKISLFDSLEFCRDLNFQKLRE